MRLRPSGRQGPVATAIQSFQSYQMDEAWTWEHLALTRARAVAGDAVLADEVEAIRLEILKAKGPASKVLSDVAEMRERIFAAKPVASEWEIKVGPGRLQDIELLAQSFALRAGVPAHRVEAQLRAGLTAGYIDRAAEADLQSAYRFLWRLQAAARLMTERPLDMATIGDGGCAFLLRETGASDLAGMASQMERHVTRTDVIVQQSLAGV